MTPEEAADVFRRVTGRTAPEFDYTTGGVMSDRGVRVPNRVDGLTVHGNVIGGVMSEPDPHTLADDTDDLDWDVDRDGRMKDHATDDEPVTKAWEG